MPFKKFILVPIFIAALAALLQVFDQSCSGMFPPEGNKGFAWISFQAWAVYFFSGCNVKGGMGALLAYALGIGASILIMILGGAFASLGFWAMPASLLLLVIPVICLERLNVSLPALFIGAGAYFAIMSYVPNATFAGAAITELVYCVIGLLLGYITIEARAAYEAKIGKKE